MCGRLTAVVLLAGGAQAAGLGTELFPHIGRQSLAHCATREAPGLFSEGLDCSSVVFSEGGRVTQILLIHFNSGPWVCVYIYFSMFVS